MNTKLLRNLGIATAVVIVTIFAVGLIEQQEQKVDSLQNQIDAWIECRNNPDSFILEKYPAICELGGEQVNQPVISSDESQWEQCISRDDVNIVDNGENPYKCITSDDVVFMEP